METSFHYDVADKQLRFRLIQRVSAKPGLELKAKGFFNTVEGKLNYRGTLKKYISVGQTNKDAGSTPFQIGLGVAAASDQFPSATDPMLTASAKKRYALLDGPNTLLTVKSLVDYEPQHKKAQRTASIKVSHKMPNFTKRQDLKVSAGVDIDWPTGARDAKPSPFMQVRENNWAVNYRRNRWFVTYDL